MKRTAKAHWTGDLKAGHGELTTESTVLNQTPFSFNTRFAAGIGSNPEELLAASHAGCFTMSLAYALSQKGLPATELETTATVHVDMSKGGITDIDLSLTAGRIPGLADAAFLEIAEDAKKNCLLSKALASVNINLTVAYGVLAAQA